MMVHLMVHTGLVTFTAERTQTSYAAGMSAGSEAPTSPAEMSQGLALTDTSRSTDHVGRAHRERAQASECYWLLSWPPAPSSNSTPQRIA
jgi:hypothetical protein